MIYSYLIIPLRMIFPVPLGAIGVVKNRRKSIPQELAV